MYHSHLLINTDDNPDRVDWKRSRLWLRNLYRVHQRLCMAFPDKDKALAGKSETQRFAEYCKPFHPAAGPDAFVTTDAEPGDVHTPRNTERGFLYRVDYPVLGSVRKPVILVQSATRPDWDYAFGLSGYTKPGKKEPHGNADFLLAAPPQVREVNFDASDVKLVLRAGEIAHEVKRGDQLSFILLANVVETRTEDGRKARHRLRIDDEIMKSDDAQRINQARRDVHLDWLKRKLEGAATLVEKKLEDPQRCHPFIKTGWIHASRGEYDKGGKTEKSDMQWWSVTYSGRLILKDPEKLRALLLSGIGPAKGFGFGLLSVGPVKEKSEA